MERGRAGVWMAASDCGQGLEWMGLGKVHGMERHGGVLSFLLTSSSGIL